MHTFCEVLWHPSEPKAIEKRQVITVIMGVEQGKLTSKYEKPVTPPQCTKAKMPQLSLSLH